MISFQNLNSIAEALSSFRENGNALFDGRDHGNYSGYNWEKTVAMLKKADPTNIAIGMLLNEMLEATINGSQVKLSRVIREDGFIDQLRIILDIKNSLDAEIAEPMAALMSRLETSLKVVSDDFGKPNTREVAICLRDAIYCMDKGLELRWLSCSDAQMTGPMPLCENIQWYPNTLAFIEALRGSLSFGAHLTRIGLNHTAVGLKHPGRVAYLSSLKINPIMGTVEEHRADGSHMAENLDLDTAVERYPKWITQKNTYGYGDCFVSVGADTHTLNHISKLPRDRVIWLAMVVEMASQRMAATRPDAIELNEVMALALPRTTNICNMPMVIQPNWIIGNISIEDMFQSMQLSPWEEKFLRPALDGLTEEVFLPVDTDIAITPASKEFVSINKGAEIRFDICAKDGASAVRMTGISSDCVGSKSEVDAARRQLFGANMIKWLMAWGNFRFAHECKQNKEWFDRKLKANLPAALSAPFMQLKPADFNCRSGHHLYSQSLKHKTYNPRCFFNVKSEVTDVAHFVPQNSADLALMLGVERESELPEFLIGWSRDLGWSTSGNCETAPYNTRERWVFSRNDSYQNNIFLEASVCINKMNVPSIHFAAKPPKCHCGACRAGEVHDRDCIVHKKSDFAVFDCNCTVTCCG